MSCTVYRVPIGLLRYRKDNGRITSDILDYEQNTGTLDDRDDGMQAEIAKFLEQKDPEKTSILFESQSCMVVNSRRPSSRATVF